MIIDTFKKGNKVLEVFQDVLDTNPRAEQDNIGKMVCFHGRYKLGDENHGYTLSTLQEFLQDDDIFWLPIYLYDHSGLSINTDGFGCQWDSGQVGCIYLSKKEFIKEFGDWSQKQAEEVLKGEIENYDHFLQGHVYGYAVVETEVCNLGCSHVVDDLESCGGFLGRYDEMLKEILAYTGFSMADKKS